MLNLNDIQYQIILNKLEAKNWSSYAPRDDRVSLLPLPKDYLIYENSHWGPIKKLIIQNRKMSFGFYAGYEQNWAGYLDFIELRDF